MKISFNKDCLVFIFLILGILIFPLEKAHASAPSGCRQIWIGSQQNYVEANVPNAATGYYYYYLYGGYGQTAPYIGQIHGTYTFDWTESHTPPYDASGNGFIRRTYNLPSGDIGLYSTYTNFLFLEWGLCGEIPSGQKISNVSSGLTPVLSSDWITNVMSTSQTGVKNVGVIKGSSKISSFDVDFSSNRDWTNVVADTDSSAYKSVFGYSGGNYTDIPGRNSASYTLYVPKSLLGMRVGFCPDATNLAGVTTSCSNLKYIDSGTSDFIGSDTVDVEVGIGNYSGYWVITGLSSKMGAFNSEGYVVGGTPADITMLTNIGGVPTDVTTSGVTGVNTVELKNTSTSSVIAELDINFSYDMNLNNFSAGSESTKAFFHATVPISTLTNGGSSSYTLYIPKGDGDKAWICPGATNLNDVSLHCSGGYYLSDGQTYNGATASVVELDGTVYWKVDGLTGTGGMSVVTGLRDTLSRLQVETSSDHTITFGTNNGLTASGQFLVLAFDPSNKAFNLSSLTLSDIKLTDNVGVDRTLGSSSDVNTWGVEIDSDLDTITFFTPTSGTGYYPASSQIVIKIGTNAGGTHQIFNPSQTGSYEETIYILNTDIEGGTLQLPIIDSDRVDITGYVSAYMHFDIDTGVGEVPGVDPIINCEFNTCRIYENGQPGLSNYTVDLGELTSAVVNKSSSTSVAHSDGGNGKINSIYFDISTNAPSGAVVTVKSANGGLQGPGTSKIPSIGISTGADGIVRSDGSDIPANSGVYGYNLPVASSQLHGTIIPNTLCDSSVKYCGAGTTPKTVFTTNNLPVDTARVRMDLAAAANYTNNPGNYTDTLTFVATATF